MALPTNPACSEVSSSSSGAGPRTERSSGRPTSGYEEAYLVKVQRSTRRVLVALDSFSFCRGFLNRSTNCVSSTTVTCAKRSIWKEVTRHSPSSNRIQTSTCSPPSSPRRPVPASPRLHWSARVPHVFRFADRNRDVPEPAGRGRPREPAVAYPADATSARPAVCVRTPGALPDPNHAVHRESIQADVFRRPLL